MVNEQEVVDELAALCTPCVEAGQASPLGSADLGLMAPEPPALAVEAFLVDLGLMLQLPRQQRERGPAGALESMGQWAREAAQRAADFLRRWPDLYLYATASMTARCLAELQQAPVHGQPLREGSNGMALQSPVPTNVIGATAVDADCHNVNSRYPSSPAKQQEAEALAGGKVLRRPLRPAPCSDLVSGCSEGRTTGPGTGSMLEPPSSTHSAQDCDLLSSPCAVEQSI